MIRPRTRAEWTELLARRIEQSGLSLGRFAREVLIRDERTVRRWSEDETTVIPQVVQDWLVDPQRSPWP